MSFNQGSSGSFQRSLGPKDGSVPAALSASNMMNSKINGTHGLSGLGSLVSPVASKRTLKPATFLASKINTKDEPGAKDKEKAPLDYEKIVQLMVAKNTQDLFDRQLAVLRRVHRRNRDGYAYGDLNFVAQLLTLTARRVESDAHPDFEPLLCDLVENCRRPLRRAKANEELMVHGKANFRDLVRALGELLSAPFRRIQLEAAFSLRYLAQGGQEKKAGVGAGPDGDRGEVFRVPGGHTVARDLRRPLREVNQEALALESIPALAVKQLKEQVEILREMTLEENPAGNFAKTQAGPAYDDGNDSSDGEDQVGDMLGEIRIDDGVSVDELVRGLLGLVHELSTSETSAAAVCESGGLVPILRLIDGRQLPFVKPLAQMGAQTLDVLIELLWNCLEHSLTRVKEIKVSSRIELIQVHRKANALYLLAEAELIAVFKGLLEEMLKKGYRHKDKELRNEVLIVISLIGKHPKSHPYFLSTGMLHLLVKYATVSEAGPDPMDEDLPNSSNFATTLEVDLELKRLLWSLLVDLCANNRENLSVVVASPLIETLLLYLEVDSQPSHQSVGRLGQSSLALSSNSAWNRPSGNARTGLENIQEKLVETDSQLSVNTNVKKFSNAQLQTLQLQALSVLLNLAPRAPARFRALGGHAHTLRLVDPEHSGGFPQLAQNAMMLLLSVVAVPDIQEELVRLDAMRIMLARFTDQNSLNSLRADAVCILSRVCKNSKENQIEFRHLGGLEALISVLKSYCVQRSRTVADQKKKSHLEEKQGAAADKLETLIVHAVDCLWNAILNNKKSQSRFLNGDGMDAVLDLLEVCPSPMRHQVTGLVADVSRNPHVLPYLKAWRSDQDMCSAVQLLLRFWEEEEALLGMVRPGGILHNLYRPLSSHTADGGDNLAGLNSNNFTATTENYRNTQSEQQFDANGSSQTTSTGAFSRLNAALKASMSLGGAGSLSSSSQKRGSVSSCDQQALAAAIGSLDLRPKIALVLKQLGFDDKDPGLTPQQKMALLMARHYEDFQESGSWMDVYEELKKEKVNPIAADRLLLDSKLEDAFNQTLHVKCKQLEFKSQKSQEEKESEKQFLAGIILQRDQEIHQQIIKRNALMPKSTVQKRKAEKEAKAKMLASSNMLRKQTSQDDFTGGEIDNAITEQMDFGFETSASDIFSEDYSPSVNQSNKMINPASDFLDDF